MRLLQSEVSLCLTILRLTCVDWGVLLVIGCTWNWLAFGMPPVSPLTQDFNLAHEQQGKNLPPWAGEAPATCLAEQPRGGRGGRRPGLTEPVTKSAQSLQQLQLGGGERIGEWRRVWWEKFSTCELNCFSWDLSNPWPLYECRKSKKQRDHKQLEQQTQHQ